MADNKLKKLIIFRSLLNDEIITKFITLYSQHKTNKIDLFTCGYYELCSILFNKNYDSIFDYLSDKILDDENIFSLMAENNKEIDEKIKKAVIHDIYIIKSLYELPINTMISNATDTNKFINYNSSNMLTNIFKKEKIDKIYSYLVEEYNTNGCGKYRTNNVFVIRKEGLIPLSKFEPVKMKDIYGYEEQKQKIICNTEKLVQDKQALNGLLIGESGTGKSTTVKALVPMFSDKKLKLIEVDKENLYLIPEMVEELEKRGLYFIIFIDDLSFESNEEGYKYLKSVIEGSIFEQPQNIIFYVTSNRRHLIKESQKDRDSEMHMRDLINEQTSLSERFGLTLLYPEPSQKEYFGIVKSLAEKFNIAYEEEELLKEAKKYALQNNGRSGRTAIQFIKTLI